jgi:AraC-like DNA-binding protein
MSNYLVDDLSYYCNVYRIPFRMPWIKSDYYDLTIVLKGELTYQVGEDIILLKKNDVLLVSPNTAYRRPAGDDNVRYISFNFSLLPNSTLHLDKYMPNALSQEARVILSSLTQKHFSPQDHSKKKIINILNYILFDLLENSEIATNNAHVRSIIRYVNENLDKKMTLTSIGKKLGLTKQYTASIFKKEMGCTVTEYINKKKMYLAKDLIFYDEMSMKEIAEYLQYDNYNYFSVLFKQYFGFSPSEAKARSKSM